MMRLACLAAILAFLSASTSFGGEPATDASALAFFESKVRPILVERCLSCHSAAEGKKVRGGLRLDTKEGWTTGGDNGPAAVPGNPDESLIVQAIKYGDPDLRMPPKGKLPEAEIQVLNDWIRQGAIDPRTGATATAKKAGIDLTAGRRHWAFQPLVRGERPEVRDLAWCRTPIDRFIAAKLDAAGLTPSPEVDRRRLIRRATFDLTGLPPTPDEIAAFLADARPDAYDHLIDRLLESPRYGERWARHWLDLARYAESHGFEHDYDRPTAYTYRDFLIEALNADLPYDTFVRWQLAGDELAPESNLALKATGFLAAGTHSTQITANQVEKERYDELDDMLGTTSTAFLGLTVGCARCHDHKYDPIPTADYYRMLSTFTTTVRSEVELNVDPKGFALAKLAHDAEHASHVAKRHTFEAETLPARLAAWELSRKQARSDGPAWVALDPVQMKADGGASFSKLEDGSIRVAGNNPEFDVYTVSAACDLPNVTGVRLEALADAALVRGGPGRADNGNFALTDLKVVSGPRYGIGPMSDLTLVNPKATFEQAGLPVSGVVDADLKSAWAVDPQFGQDQVAVFETAADVPIDSACILTFRLSFKNNARHGLGRFRLAATASPRPIALNDDGVPPALKPILALAPADRSEAQSRQLLDWFRTIDAEWRALDASVAEHARSAPQMRGSKALISTEGRPAVRLHTQGGDFLEKTHYLKRGDVNQKQGEAPPGFLQVLENASEGEARWTTAPPPGWHTSYRRAALARWMTDLDAGAGALAARVAVNRLWHHHLGRGIVATPSDFGNQGEPPTHPELLDWLASELVRGGWKLKPLHKLIMTSAVYMQGTTFDPAKAAIDPEDRLLWRRTRKRLEAEAVRDSLLFVAGQLDGRMYGPGSLDERMKRRSVYFAVKRSKLIPMMSLFDAPDALQPIPARSSTTIAPQSLFLMNSPLVRDWAEAFAGRLEAKPDGRIDAAYAIAVGRPPTPDEASRAVEFLAGQAESYRLDGQADADHRALGDFCQVLMGLNEFLYAD
ncbi:PSD1 and planctomycete cytochrome C domain-containing protein [Isosphaeraceae bacterium EP7]